MLLLQVLLSSSISAGLTLLRMLVVEMGSSGTSGGGDSSRLSGTGTAPVKAKELLSIAGECSPYKTQHKSLLVEVATE